MSSSHLFKHARFVSVLTALAMVLVVLFVWNVVRQEQAARLNSETRSNVAHVAARLEAYVTTRLSIAKQFRKEWRIGHVATRADFAHRVENARSLFPDIQAINWADSDGVIRGVEPYRGNEAALGLNLRKLASRKETLERAARTGTLQITPPVDLAQGGRGFVAYQPVADTGAAKGFLNIVFRAEPLIRSAVNEGFFSSYDLSITDGDATVFNSAGEGAVSGSSRIQGTISVGNRSWMIAAAPAPSTRRMHASFADELVLAVGMLLSTASVILIWQTLTRYGNLRDSEWNLRELLEKSPIGVAIIYQEAVGDRLVAKRMYVNPALADMFRASSVESLLVSDISRTWIDADQLQAVNESMNNDVDLVDFEVKRRRLDGTEWWVSMNTRPIRFADRPCTMVWHFDITERKLAEQQFAETMMRFRAVVDASPSRITLRDLEGKFLLVNKAFAEDWGTTVENAIGRTLYDFTNEAEADQSVDYDRAIMSSGDAIEDERWVTLPDGRETFVKRLKFPVRDAAGDIVGIGTINNDITELKNRESELAEKTVLLQTILDTVPGAVTVRDRDNRYTYLNKQAAKYLNKPIDELIGENLSEQLNGAYLERLDIFLDKVWRADGMISDPNYKANLPNLSGTTFWSIGSPIIDDTGETTGIVAIYLDVTQQRKVEAQLRQAQKMEVVGQLTGGVAHDFNNMLGVIIGNLDFLAEELADNPELSKLVESATAAALGGANLNQQLLAFSRQQPLSPQAIDLNSNVSTMLTILPRSLGETIEIEADLADGLWLADADPAQVESALLNLAVNARDAMPTGGKLMIETANVAISTSEAARLGDIAAGDYVMLALTDTGSGMAPDILEHVFEPFFTTKDVGKGTGLGLSMVFGFAKQSGGHVTIGSESGMGTAVRLYLPKAQSTEADTSKAPENLPAVENKSVLLVEDDEELRALIVSMLNDLGFDVLEAADGHAAIETIGRIGTTINLLLTDMVLPGGIAGQDIAAEVGRIWPDTKIMFMSGYPSNAVAQRNGNDGDVLIMEKPFRKAEFARRVLQAINA